MTIKITPAIQAALTEYVAARHEVCRAGDATYENPIAERLVRGRRVPKSERDDVEAQRLVRESQAAHRRLKAATDALDIVLGLEDVW